MYFCCKIIIAIFLSSAFLHAEDLAPVYIPWKITKTEWSPADERNYSLFVEAIGKANCRSVNECLKSNANPYRNTDPAKARFTSDCADLPYVLRSYFAQKNGLPFSVVSAVTSIKPENLSEKDQKRYEDIRYSPLGNRVIERIDFTTKAKNTFPDLLITLRGVSNHISSAMFRFHPKLKVETSPAQNKDWGILMPDFYPVKISRKSVKPGTIIYDPNGHVAVVYSVADDGRILFMDAHPDQSLTRGTYGRKFSRSSPGMGAGFKNFRPLKLFGATWVKEGSYFLGGKVFLLADKFIQDYDTTQFFGSVPNPKGWNGIFEFDGQKTDYYDWTRMSLAVGALKFHPVEEMKNMMRALCQDLKDRVSAVDAATIAGVNLKPAPANLPSNIYGTDGEWESFSSPSRDARLKTSFKELHDQVLSMVEAFQKRDPRVVYEGADLVKDLLNTYEVEANACTFSYKNSEGKLVPLNFESARQRLFLMSFDPYQCIERRWGANTPEELASCKDDANKTAWYEAEQRLRNQIDRNYDVQMGFTVVQLKAKIPGSGVDTAPLVDLKGSLSKISR